MKLRHRSSALASALALVALAGLALPACGGGSPDAKAPAGPTTSAAAAQSTPAQPGAAAKLEITPSIRAAVDAADRDAEDKALDGGRKPAELLAFMGVKPGWKVAELAAGGGYSTELLVRTVGASGVVYGQNSQDLIAKFLEKPWTARLAKPVNKAIVKVTRDFDDPLPPEGKDLDGVLCNLFYHDLFWIGSDRAKMNAAIFKALKPGGVYVVTDHSGRAGTGSTEVKSIHRIEEKVVREEIEKAGFKLAAEGDFLRNPDDARDWNTAPFAAGEKRGKSDRFALKFVKP